MTSEEIKQAKRDELKWETLSMVLGALSLFFAYKRYQTKKKQIE
jgi:hypothetical protein